MKLSKLTTDRAAEVLVTVAQPIAEILKDSELREKIGKKTKKGLSSLELYAVGVERLAELVPFLLQKHKSAVYTILAALNEKTEDEIAAQNILVTIRQVKELIQDKDLLDFFKSSATEEQTA